MADSAENSPTRRQRIAAAALYVALVLLLLSRVLDPADDFGDPSFQQALGYFMAEGFQAGDDYIFTYGPLGHFVVPRFQPGLFWLDYAVGLLMGLAAAWPVFVCLRSAAFTYLERAAVLIAFLLTAHSGPGPETRYLMAALLTVALIRRGVVSHPAAMAALGLALAFLSLGKFNLLVLSIGFIGYLSLQFGVHKRFQNAAILVAVYALGLIGFWLAAGQSPANFPKFVADSIEISQAYNTAMVLEGSLATRILGVVAITSVLAATLPFLPFRFRRIPAALDAVFVLVFAFIVWKSGMVRQHAHEIKLFLPAMILPVLVAVPESPGPLVRGLRTAAVVLTLTAGVAGYVLAVNIPPASALAAPMTKVAGSAYQIVAPWARLNDLEERWRELQIYDAWPTASELIGDASIDIFPPEHRVLLINEFNYKPRYVYQGYQACTPRLLELNGESYWNAESAPEYVFYRSMPIDYRFPYMEDSQALLALFYAYRPVLLERGLVLFERMDNPPQGIPQPEVLAEGTLAPGEQLDVPESPRKWQLLSLEFEAPSPLLARGRDFTMTVTYADESTREYRVLPSMTELPFLLNRFWPPGSPVHENNDYREDRIVALSLSNGGEWSVRYRLLAVDPPRTAQAAPGP